MQKKDIDVVVAGHVALDIIPTFISDKEVRVEEIFRPGGLVNVGEVAISTGGPVSNTGLALHRLGIKVELMGKLGDDPFGRVLLEKLKQVVSIEGMKVIEGEKTAYTIVLAPPGIDRIFFHNPGANNTFSCKDVNFELVERTRLFHLGYPPLMRRLYENDGEQLARIFRMAKESGAITSLDVSVPDPNSPSGKADWKLILKNALPFIDIFLPSAEEILYMLEKEECLRRLKQAKGDELLVQFEGEDLTRLSGKMLELGAKIAVIKCGYRGFYVRTAQKDKFSQFGAALPGDLDNWAGRELWEPPCRVSGIASATGSGDSSIAGFLSAYLKGKTLEMALKYACATGAQHLSALDAVSGIKSWEETTLRIEEGREKGQLSIETPGWRYDEKGKVWHGPKDRG